MKSAHDCWLDSFLDAHSFPVVNLKESFWKTFHNGYIFNCIFGFGFSSFISGFFNQLPQYWAPQHSLPMDQLKCYAILIWMVRRNVCVYAGERRCLKPERKGARNVFPSELRSIAEDDHCQPDATLHRKCCTHARKLNLYSQSFHPIVPFEGRAFPILPPNRQGMRRSKASDDHRGILWIME